MKNLFVVVLLVFAPVPVFAAEPLCPQPDATPTAAAPDTASSDTDAPEGATAAAPTAASSWDFSFAAPDFERAGTHWTGGSAWESNDSGSAKSSQSSGKVWTATPDGFQAFDTNADVTAYLLKREALREMTVNAETGETQTKALDAYCQFVSPDTATN